MILGNYFLQKFVEKTDKYIATTDEKEKTLLRDNSFDKWTSYRYLRSADTNKYGKLKQNLQSQYALGNNQFPETVTKMTDVMANHQWDEK